MDDDIFFGVQLNSRPSQEFLDGAYFTEYYNKKSVDLYYYRDERAIFFPKKIISVKSGSIKGVDFFRAIEKGEDGLLVFGEIREEIVSMFPIECGGAWKDGNFIRYDFINDQSEWMKYYAEEGGAADAAVKMYHPFIKKVYLRYSQSDKKVVFGVSLD